MSVRKTHEQFVDELQAVNPMVQFKHSTSKSDRSKQQEGVPWLREKRFYRERT